jgi:hypothetical protein
MPKLRSFSKFSYAGLLLSRLFLSDFRTIFSHIAADTGWPQLSISLTPLSPLFSSLSPISPMDAGHYVIFITFIGWLMPMNIFATAIFISRLQLFIMPPDIAAFISQTLPSHFHYSCHYFRQLSY